MAKVLQKCKIIIWDECTMAHKHSLEVLDRMIRDLSNNTKLFGDALFLLSGDLRQTLPVIPRTTYADEINACIKQPYLWRNVSTLSLNTNIRVQMQTIDTIILQAIAQHWKQNNTMAWTHTMHQIARQFL